jgi:23S rRNA pseudouridine2605 synthase
MRLNRFLASAGLGSRRSCESLITAGKVQLNGEICTTLATAVGPEDEVVVNGRKLRAQDHLYVLLNKPKGFLCTAHDDAERGRRTVFDLLPREWPRLFHVGRLDMDSEGLLLLTNDGDLALRMTHPRYKIEKEYEVTLDRPFEPGDAATLCRGVFIAPEDDAIYRPRAKAPAKEPGAPAPEPAPAVRMAAPRVRAKAEAVFPLDGRRVKVVLKQGMKRQIRLMFLQLGYKVKRLVRKRIGALVDSHLRSGAWRELTPSEVAILSRAGATTSPKSR